MIIYVVRHGETEFNAQNRICGITDLPLTDRGLEQAKSLADKAVKHNIDVIISSPLIRARQTADVIAEALDLPVAVDDRLAEQNYGIYEGLDRGNADFNANKRQFCMAYPKGESMFRLAQRVYNLIDDIKASYPNRNVLLVCHGGVCRMIRSYFEGMTNEQFASYSPVNCSISKYNL